MIDEEHLLKLEASIQETRVEKIARKLSSVNVWFNKLNEQDKMNFSYLVLAKSQYLGRTLAFVFTLIDQEASVLGSFSHNSAMVIYLLEAMDIYKTKVIEEIPIDDYL